MSRDNDQGQGYRPAGAPWATFLAAVKRGVIAETFLTILCLVLLGAAAFEISTIAPSPWSQILVEVGAAMMVAGGVAGPIQLVMLRNYRRLEKESEVYLRDRVETELQVIATQIERQAREHAQAVASAVSSLAAMREIGASEIFPSRFDSSSRISRDLLDPRVKRIRIIAVSLYSFVGPGNNLNKTWRSLEGLIKNGFGSSEDKRALDIKILIIDPHSLGAQLRYRAEERDFAHIAGQLQDEVGSTARHLLKLKQENQKISAHGVTFDFRLYRTPPIFFLCSTDHASYVQPYYFWRSRRLEAEARTPVLRFEPRLEEPGEGLHDQLEDHFKWIWTRASVTPEAVLDEGNLGLDRGVCTAGAVNVFTDSEGGMKRILSLLSSAKRRVFIQGISLDSFFDESTQLYDKIRELIEKGDVEFKCLILNPECRQAKYRAYREYLTVAADQGFNQFGDGERYRDSQLFRDTTSTIDTICRILLPAAKGATFQARLYDAAPACFMLLVDDSVLVEQYHYGKITEGRSRLPKALGKNMPLVEYMAQGVGDGNVGLYERDPHRDPARLLEDHFRFVFDHCSQLISTPSVDERAGRQILLQEEDGQVVPNNDGAPPDVVPGLKSSP